MFQFEQIKVENIDEQEYNYFADKLIFQTKEWIQFIMNTQDVEPLVLRITKDDEFIGYFTGFLFSKFGMKIVGSPFRGWTTSYMGFNIHDDCRINRASLIKPLWKYLKETFKCVYCEIVDRYITAEDAKAHGLEMEHQGSLMLSTQGTDEQLLSGYTKHCRKHIRQFEKADVTIEIMEPTDAFAQTFYEQLVKVFSYQNLLPSYDLARVKALFAALKEKHDLVCTRVVENSTGKWISSTIGFGYNKHCYTWASTSLREACDHNQSVGQRWFVIKYWRDRGYVDMDMVGIRGYKHKFNPTEIQIPRIVLSRFKLLIVGRRLAQKLYWMINGIKGKLKKA